MRYARTAEKMYNNKEFLLEKFEPNFMVNSNQCPQGCQIIRVSGIYGIMLLSTAQKITHYAQ